jgi:hypothetical protein
MYHEFNLFTESHGFQEFIPTSRNTVYTSAHFVSCHVSTSIIVRRIRKIATNGLLALPRLFVCLSVRMEHLGSNWTDFHEILCFNIFRKFVDKIKV